jgi:hypothetical protein
MIDYLLMPVDEAAEAVAPSDLVSLGWRAAGSGREGAA